MTRLPMRCLACGSAQPPRNRFCGQCGGALAQTGEAAPQSDQTVEAFRLPASVGSGPQSERKQVTVLFADIKGSLEILAERDPEDANRVLDNTLHRMMDAVHRYQGTVSQARGDGIMAIFGAPLAQEDHPVRACYAALKIVESVAAYSEESLRTEGVAVHVRVGLNTGEVVVRPIRNDLYVEYTAVGETTHLAARMEQSAAPGRILVTASTARLVQGYIQLRPIGPIAVKGLSERLTAFEVVAAGNARSRLQATFGRGLTPYVARRAELDVLAQALTRARTCRGQAVAIRGEAGVGKSRLVQEFVRAQAADCLLLEVQPARFGEVVSLSPVVVELRKFFGIVPGEAQESIRERVTARIAAHLPDALAHLPAVLDVLDALPDDHAFRAEDPAQRRGATIAAIGAMVVLHSRVQPVVVVFEDLHWNDSLTHDLIDELLSACRKAAVLLLACHRPEYAPAWPAAAHVRQLELSPLAPEGTAQMLEAMLGADATDNALVHFLHERTGGNPFFVEEIVQSLIETHVLEPGPERIRQARPIVLTQVPTTVEALLASRIDRLPSAEKRLLQEAAVLGDNVTLPLLQALSGHQLETLQPLLHNLKQQGFLRQLTLYPDEAFGFKHALTQQVAYSELLHERRREIHVRTVAAMETVCSGHLDDVVDQIGQHALRGRLWAKAMPYLRQAAARAADRHAYLESARLYEQALQALEHLEPAPRLRELAVDIRFELRNVLQPMGDHERIAGVLKDAADIAEELGDPLRIGWVQSYLTDHFWIRGKAREAAAAGEHALRIASEQGDLAMQVVTRLPLGLLHHTRGDYRLAMEHFSWNIDTLKQDNLHSRFGLFVLPSAFARAFRAWTLAEMGDFPSAFDDALAAISIAEEAGHAMSLGYSHLGLGVVHLRRGDMLNAMATLERALATRGFADSRVGMAYVAFHLGYARVMAGDVERGLAQLRDTVELAEAHGFAARHALRLAHYAEALALAGHHEEAESVAARAVATAREQDEVANEAHALRAAGEVALRGPQPGKAGPMLDSALALATKLGMRPLQLQCHRGLARQHDRVGVESIQHASMAAVLEQAMAMQEAPHSANH